MMAELAADAREGAATRPSRAPLPSGDSGRMCPHAQRTAGHVEYVIRGVWMAFGSRS